MKRPPERQARKEWIQRQNRPAGAPGFSRAFAISGENKFQIPANCRNLPRSRYLVAGSNPILRSKSPHPMRQPSPIGNGPACPTRARLVRKITVPVLGASPLLTRSGQKVQSLRLPLICPHGGGPLCIMFSPILCESPRPYCITACQKTASVQKQQNLEFT